MNENIINEISKDLNIEVWQIKNTLSMLEDGNTIPFIARYRKEKTGNLNEEDIRKINIVYEYQVNLQKRKDDVIRLIDEKGLLTEELKENILKASKIVEVDDLYLPFKEKKKTKATDAIKNGLEPLAKIIMSMPDNIDIDSLASKYINDNVKTKEDAIQGAKYIISEWISDNAFYRKWIRQYMYNNGLIISKKKRDSIDENFVYQMYYDYSERIKFIKPHRILAINRGEKEGILSVNISLDTDYVLKELERRIIKKETNVKDIIIDSIKDSYKRLIEPSIEREIRADLKENASNEAIKIFSANLESLLLTPPLKGKIVLGLDPAFRTGCKLAVVDKTSRVLNISVIYPHEPQNKWDEAKSIIKDIFKKYDIDIVAIGNGTASRESEKLVAETINEYKDKKIEYIIVSEAGASVYSASPLAISEFPDLTVEKRSAISIARRLQDPLNELVKIDSKSIGVGQYQHDCNEKKLDESLDFVVSKAVNNVGVNLNTASKSILKYVSGLTTKNIDKLVDYREKNGKFHSRRELEKLKILSPKAYEQSIGFMRIVDGDNPLDRTGIHPESYDICDKLLNEVNATYSDIGTNELSNKLDNIDIEKECINNSVDKYTLEDIIDSLKKPTRDYRDSRQAPLLRSDILKLEDLKEGMELEGTVRNVVDFGVFVDIGLKNDGLLHISKFGNKYVKHPLDVFSVGDIITCYVDSIDMNKKKVNLTMIKP